MKVPSEDVSSAIYHEYTSLAHCVFCFARASHVAVAQVLQLTALLPARATRARRRRQLAGLAALGRAAAHRTALRSALRRVAGHAAAAARQLTINFADFSGIY